MHKVARKQLGSVASAEELSRDDIPDHMITEAIPEAVEIGALPEKDAQEAKEIINERMARSNPMRVPIRLFQSYDAEDDGPAARRAARRKEPEGSMLYRLAMKRMPALTWIPEIRTDSVKSDLVAGLTVGVMVIPQSMSYANIAGLEYIYGMYSACVPTLVYGFFGQSRHLAVGPVALVSLLVSAGLQDQLAAEDCPGWDPSAGVNQNEVCPTEYAGLAILCALVIGVMQVAASLCKLGFIINFLGHPVTSGFTSGAAIIIGLSQVKYILGYSIEKSQFFHTTFFNILKGLDQTNPPELILGLTWLLFLVVNKKLSKKYKKQLGMMGPLGPLICCAVGTLLLWATPALREDFHVHYVGDIPSGSIPLSIQHWKFNYLGAVIPTAMTSCLIGYMESIAIGKNLAAKHNYEIEAGQELFALGIANVVGAAFSCYAVTGSFSRSAVNDSTGAKSQLSGLITAVVMFLTLMFLTPLFYYLPKFALAAIVISSVVPLVAYNEAIKLFREKKHDCFLWVIAFLGTLFLGVLYGIALAVLLSLMIVVSESVRPQVSILWMVQEGNNEIYRPMKQDPGGLFVKNVLIARIGSSMYFANASFIKEVLLSYVSDMETINPTSYIVLEMTPVVSLDSSALHVLHDVVTEFGARKIHIAFAMLNPRVIETMRRSGLSKHIGKNWFHPTVHAAVQHCMNHKLALDQKAGVVSTIPKKAQDNVADGPVVVNDVDVHTQECGPWNRVTIRTSTAHKATITSDISNVMGNHQLFIGRAKIEAESGTGTIRQTYLVQDCIRKASLSEDQVADLVSDLRALVGAENQERHDGAASARGTTQLRTLEVALEREAGKKRYLEDVMKKNNDLVESLLQQENRGNLPVVRDVKLAPVRSELPEDPEVRARVRLLEPPLNPLAPPEPILPEGAGGIEKSIASWAHGLDDADTMLAEMRRRLQASSSSLASAIRRNGALANPRYPNDYTAAAGGADVESGRNASPGTETGRDNGEAERSGGTKDPARRLGQ